MSVYIDNAFDGDWGKWSGGGHLQADTADELHAFAAQLGLKRAWFQTRPGRPERDHYDCTQSKRYLALSLGAIDEDAMTAGRDRRLRGANAKPGSAARRSP